MYRDVGFVVNVLGRFGRAWGVLSGAVPSVNFEIYWRRVSEQTYVAGGMVRGARG